MKNRIFALLILFCSFTIYLGAQGTCASPDGTFTLYDGSFSSYATSNANGWCYNGLNADQTYCWTFRVPSSGSGTIRFIMNNCGTCSGSNTLIVNPACGTSCTNSSIACATDVLYDNTCAVVTNGLRLGCLTCGAIYTFCFTVPAGCQGMNICPMFYCTEVNCINSLPIELLAFNGISKNNKVTLSWTTATETNNNYFTIEKSTDCITFYPIGDVEGKGNKTTVSDYLYVDDGACPGINYYRLKQTDFDGVFSYSSIIAVDCIEAILVKTEAYDIMGNKISSLKTDKVYILYHYYSDGTVEIQKIKQ